MIAPGEAVLIGVSGGVDSLALLYALYELRERLGCILHIGHLDHGLRPDSASDADFVRQHAEHLNVPITTSRIEMLTLIEDQNVSVETLARTARYEFYESVCRETGATKVALGHHRGDQAETVLMNLLRGASGTGLKGIRPVRDGKFIRILLNSSRNEIETFVGELGLKPREDPTNLQRDYRRNRIRLELLPLLKQDYNPNIERTLAQTADLLRAESDYLDDIAYEAFCNCRLKSTADDEVSLNRSLFLRHKLALQRRILRIAFKELPGEMTEIAFNHFESILKLAKSDAPNASCNLPNHLECRRSYDELTIQKAGERMVEFEYNVSVPGKTRLPALNAELITAVVETPVGGHGGRIDDRFNAVFDLDKIRLPLKLRSRRPGDRFQPFGMEGTKKVKKLLIDAKVPERNRLYTPIFISRSEILWVVGFRTSNHGKVTARTLRSLCVTYKSKQSH